MCEQGKRERVEARKESGGQCVQKFALNPVGFLVSFVQNAS